MSSKLYKVTYSPDVNGEEKLLVEVVQLQERENRDGFKKEKKSKNKEWIYPNKVEFDSKELYLRLFDNKGDVAKVLKRAAHVFKQDNSIKAYFVG